MLVSIIFLFRAAVNVTAALANQCICLIYEGYAGSSSSTITWYLYLQIAAFPPENSPQWANIKGSFSDAACLSEPSARLLDPVIFSIDLRNNFH